MSAFVFTTRGGSKHNLKVGKYPDGSPLVTHNLLYEPPVESILVRTSRVDDLVAVLFWVDALRARGNQEITLALPFIPGARQDRLMSDGDRLFTAKSVAQAINTREFKKVVVLDPHSEVAPALIDRCVAIKPADILAKQDVGYLKEKYQAVISPDAGAEKRALGVAQLLGVPLIQDVGTGKISGFGCEKFSYGHIKSALVVDDICDGGGTFLGLRSVVPEETKLGLYVTHGLFTAGTEKLAAAFDQILCTDSLLDLSVSQDVKIIEVCNYLTKYV
jgi:ribose-phosphate pyrophosphokinase